jgi:glucose dehydrogenase
MTGFDFATKLSGWFLLFMLAAIIFESLAVGVFAVGWCLHSIFGHYAFVVVFGLALLVAWVHHRHELSVRKQKQRSQKDFALY